MYVAMLGNSGVIKAMIVFQLSACQGIFCCVSIVGTREGLISDDHPNTDINHNCVRHNRRVQQCMSLSFVTRSIVV